MNFLYTIKAKDIRTNNWVYGHLIKEKGEYYIIERLGRKLKIESSTIREYTGYNDFERNDVYEGDTVITEDNKEAILLWDKYRATYYLKFTDPQTAQECEGLPLSRFIDLNNPSSLNLQVKWME